MKTREVIFFIFLLTFDFNALQYLKNVDGDIQNKFSDEELEIFHDACAHLSKERNPVSHTETRSIDEVIALRIKTIEVLNKVINIVF